MITCFSPISVPASALPSSIEGRPLPDKWHQIDISAPLDLPEADLIVRDFNVSLVERTPIDVCTAIIVSAACLNIVDHVVDYAKGFAGVIKSL
jgi:hypothetical protein